MASEASVKKRGRKPKADVQLEFEQLTQEVQEEAASSSAKLRQMLKLQEEEVRNSVKDVSVEEVMRRFADFRLNLSNIMGPLSDSIAQEIQLLSNLRQSVNLEQRELERLHKIDVAQTTIDQLIAEYAQRQEQLEAEITSMQEQWDADQAAREAEVEEYDENLAKSRKRETEEYEYKKNLERKKAQDKYDEEVRLREKQNKDKQELLERSWNERESAIKSQEDELQQLRNTVNEFPDRLEQEVAKAASEATRQTEQRLSHELALVRRDADAEHRIAQMRIETLESQIHQLNTRITVMQSQLDEAKKQVQDIAVKAIEGASGAKALSHINQIAMEQAKGRPGQL